MEGISGSDLESFDEDFILELDKEEILFLEGGQDTDLYIVQEGELMVCIAKGTQVTPLSYLGAGEFLGELSFFDGRPRSANVIAVKPSKLVRIPVDNMNGLFPTWLVLLGRFLSKRIRSLDEVIRKSGIKRKREESLRPLTASEQGHYSKIIEAAKSKQLVT